MIREQVTPSNNLYCFFNDTATTEIYTLSLHDALPIFEVHVRPPVRQHTRPGPHLEIVPAGVRTARVRRKALHHSADRKSTRLNSSHANISYAVFCLKKTECL